MAVAANRLDKGYGGLRSDIMNVYVVVRFDPVQCGACGNGSLDKIFMSREAAQRYIQHAGARRGVSWEVKEMQVELCNEEVGTDFVDGVPA
jgi:hypothetical protein